MKSDKLGPALIHCVDMHPKTGGGITCARISQATFLTLQIRGGVTNCVSGKRQNRSIKK
jgi:hypothetical protein